MTRMAYASETTVWNQSKVQNAFFFLFFNHEGKVTKHLFLIPDLF